MAPSLPVQVARELGRRIVAGTYEPGTLIEDETRLVERFQVSRVVVRDAIKILVSKGLLEVRRGIGTKVKSRNHWTLWDDDVLAWHISAPPNYSFLQQMMDIRIAFEPKAAYWASKRATKEDLAVIKDACRKMEEEAEQGSVEKFVIADALFHKAVLRAAHNEFLTSMEGVIYSALLVSVQITNKDPRQNGTSIPFHIEVYEAIFNRDAELAERLTEKLLSDAIMRLETQFGKY